jgi:dihydrofolate reductase
MRTKIPEIVVALDCAGGFGKDGKIPWHIPEDLQHFKNLTAGHVCVMGRRTYNDMLDMRVKHKAMNGNNDPITEILPGRESYVVTSNKDYQTPGATRVDSLGNVQDKMRADPRKLFVIGGRQLYIQALSWCDTVHATVIKEEKPFDCDVFFPIEVLNKKFTIVSGTQTDNAYYVVYKRK